jgi:hypothetical protein
LNRGPFRRAASGMHRDDRKGVIVAEQPNNPLAHFNGLWTYSLPGVINYSDACGTHVEISLSRILGNNSDNFMACIFTYLNLC